MKSRVRERALRIPFTQNEIFMAINWLGGGGGDSEEKKKKFHAFHNQNHSNGISLSF